MSMTRRAFLAGAPMALVACSGDPVWAPDQVVNQAIYRSGGPSQLTLFTVNNTYSGNGAHTALLVDASQRVLFDPAGSFETNVTPERNDVLFGFTPAAEQAFVSYHSRALFYMVIQTLTVPPAVAEQALQLAMQNGAVPQANCARTTSKLLRQLLGFESIRRTWSPNKLSDSFGALPGVTSREVRELD